MMDRRDFNGWNCFSCLYIVKLVHTSSKCGIATIQLGTSLATGMHKSA